MYFNYKDFKQETENEVLIAIFLMSLVGLRSSEILSLELISSRTL